MIRTTYIILWVLLSTIVLGILAIIISLFSRTGNIVHLIARIWGRGILFVSRIRVTVEGLAQIDPLRSYIYMSNHQSNFDIPVLLAHLPVQFRWLAKAELFKIPIFGRAMRGAGYVRIDRFNRESAIDSINEAAAKMKDGVSVMIFPEGTRSRDGNISPFKKGGFVMAVDSGVPIVPIILRGTLPIMGKSSLRINTGDVSLQIEKPIETTGYTRETKNNLIEMVRSVICQGFEKGNPER
jgi:1-acyl-sn-glycerol-3-phosphate acyltransferase